MWSSTPISALLSQNRSIFTYSKLPPLVDFVLRFRYRLRCLFETSEKNSAMGTTFFLQIQKWKKITWEYLQFYINLQICTALSACSKPIILGLIFYTICNASALWRGHLGVELKGSFCLSYYHLRSWLSRSIGMIFNFFRNISSLGLIFALINNRHQRWPSLAS